MAKKKKTARTYRRRRIGAIGGGSVQTFAGVAVGALVARLVGQKLASMTNPLDPKIVSAIQLAGGVVLSMQKQPVVKAAGLGMFGAGAVGLGQSLKLIAGVGAGSSYQQYPSLPEVSSINGNRYQGLNYLGNPQGSPELSVIGGVGNPEGSPELQVIGEADCLY